MRCVGFTLSGSSPEAVALTICTSGISQMADYPITTQPPDFGSLQVWAFITTMRFLLIISRVIDAARSQRVVNIKYVGEMPLN